MTASINIGIGLRAFGGGEDIAPTDIWWYLEMTPYWNDSMDVILPSGNDYWDTPMNEET